MRAIDCLKASAGFSLIEELVEHTSPTAFRALAGVDDLPEKNDTIYAAWESCLPTWAELFRALKEMDLNELAGRMEKCLREAPDYSPQPPPDKEGDSEEEEDGEQINDC